MRFYDAQQALGFLLSQTTYIESQVVATVYPDIQYPALVPVDTSANEWAKSVTYFSTNQVGRAGWFHHLATDMHVADIERDKHEIGIEMADVGYRYSLQELGWAMMIPGTNLSADRAGACRRSYEEFVDDVLMHGSAEKAFSGLINYPGITSVTAAHVGDQGATDSPYWANKDGDQILADVNDLLSGQYQSTLTVELADTLLLPIGAMSLLATRRLPNTTMTILQFLATNNVFSHNSNRPLMIRSVRGLESAAPGGEGRMIAYRRDPQVLKAHIPMTHRFLQPWQVGPLVFDVPGIFRFGGLEVRRPGAFRYLDHISPAAESES